MLNKINDRVRSVNLIILLLLITSPGFSLLGSFLGLFIPNQRVAFILTLLFLLGEKFTFRKIYIRIWCLSISMMFLIMLRLTLYPADIRDTSDVGLVVFLASLPAFIELFNRRKKYLFKSLLIVMGLQVFVAIFQNIMMANGFVDMAGMFDNYHRLDEKVDYVYPLIITGFYRTSGFFIESSQYSIFLCFCYVCMGTVAVSDKEKAIAKYVKYFILLAVLINASITGYFTILLLLLSNLKRNIGMIGFLALLFALIVFMSSNMSELSTTNDFLVKKIAANTIGYSEESDELDAERSRSFFYHFETVITNRPLLGYGDLKIENNRWDFISTYFYGYGIAGFTIMIATVTLILSEAPISCYLSLLVAFATNGNLQTPMFLIILPVVFLSKKNKLGLSKMQE